jgi:hypothetical protein
MRSVGRRILNFGLDFVWFGIGIVATLFFGLSDASGLIRADLERVFSRPLIVGIHCTRYC